MTESDPVRLTVGDPAPQLSLVNQDGLIVKLSDYIGKKIVLYFYPKDLTPGCTTQAKELTEIIPKLRAHNYEVFGVSPDSAESHKEFISRIGIGFDLLSDPNKSTMRQWGTYGKKMMYGRETLGVIRSTFVINENGVITKATYGTKATGHAARLARELDLET